MITIKPIATISYNSESALVMILDDMIKDHTIEFYAFIPHIPEEDETKKHIHLFVIPSKRVDTFLLQERFKEPDPNNSLPLGVINFRSSKWGDWFLYAIHDIDYLLSKGETRKFHYQRDDINVSDHDYFMELVHTCDMARYKIQRRFREMVQSGMSWYDLCIQGFVPVDKIYQYDKLYNIMVAGLDFNKTVRGNHDRHD